MTTILNNGDFAVSSLAALSIVSGVNMTNTAKQMGNLKSGYGLAGGALFVGGWGVMAKALGSNAGTYTRSIYLACAMVVAAVAIQKADALKYEVPYADKLMPLLFAGGWILLGSSLFLANPTSRFKFFGPIAAALVLVSMVKILPIQRDGCYIDGPGYPMFLIAWMMIVILHSSTKYPNM